MRAPRLNRGTPGGGATCKTMHDQKEKADPRKSSPRNQIISFIREPKDFPLHGYLFFMLLDQNL